MKLAKKISKGFALCAALAIMGTMGGVLTSCSNGSEETGPEVPPKGNEKITFDVTEDSTNKENTTLIFKYERSAADANELVTIENCGIVVEANDAFLKTIDKLEFALDEYGEIFNGGEKNEDGKITDLKYAKDYKVKVSLGKQVKKGDKVVVYYNKGVGAITGEGKETDAFKTLVVSLIDTDEKVDYYKELVAEGKNYQPLFPKSSDESGDGNSSGEQGNGGGGSGQGGDGNGAGNGGQGDSNNGGGQGNGGNGGNSGQASATDPDVKEGWTAIAVGGIEKYAGQEGTANYTVTKNNNGSITISHDAAMALYASCSFKPNFGNNNTLYTKITNNSDVTATVQVQVNKAGTEANGYAPTPTVTAVYVDGKKQSGDLMYSVELTIPAKGNVVIVNKFDASKKPDTVAISLNSQEEIAGTVAKGNITVSGISMKKVIDDSELGTDETGSGQGGEGSETPSEEIVFDFTKTTVEKDENDKDIVKLDKVYYCSLQSDLSKFSAEDGVALGVDKSWDGALKISTESLNLSNKNCIIEYKIDEGWEYTSENGKKCLIQLISEEDSNYKATELSQGEFANDPAETSSWKTATIDNIYANNWDAEKGADLTKIIAIKINTTDGKGTIHIKSIKFVDK